MTDADTLCGLRRYGKEAVVQKAILWMKIKVAAALTLLAAGALATGVALTAADRGAPPPRPAGQPDAVSPGSTPSTWLSSAARRGALSI